MKIHVVDVESKTQIKQCTHYLKVKIRVYI